MQDQRAMLEDERSEFQEKLRNLRAYARALKESASKHDLDESHYSTDLMRAENDAQYYEAEIGRLTEALGGAPNSPGGAARLAAGLSQLGGVSLAAASVAFVAGVLLGWAFLPPRRDR